MMIFPSFGYWKGNQHFQTVFHGDYFSIHLKKIYSIWKNIPTPVGIFRIFNQTCWGKEHPLQKIQKSALFKNWSFGKKERELRNYDDLSLIHLKTWSALEFLWAHPHLALGSSNPLSPEQLECLENVEYWWLLNAWGGGRKVPLGLFSLQGENREQDEIWEFLRSRKQRAGLNLGISEEQKIKSRIKFVFCSSEIPREQDEVWEFLGAFSTGTPHSHRTQLNPFRNNLEMKALSLPLKELLEGRKMSLKEISPSHLERHFPKPSESRQRLELSGAS